MYNVINKLVGWQQCFYFDNRFELFCSLILCRKTRYKTYRFKKYCFLCDHSAGDQNSVRSLIATDMYKRAIKEMELPKRATVIDIGANVGGFMALLAYLEIDIKKAWCIELNPLTASRLVLNMAVNFPRLSSVHNLAVGPRDGSVQLLLGGGGTGDSIYPNRGTCKDGEMQTIKMGTFDSFWGKYIAEPEIDLLKVDIEGAEFEVIMSGTATKLVCCKNLIIEMHPNAIYSHADLIGCLGKMGFVMTSGGKAIEDGTKVFTFKSR